MLTSSANALLATGSRGVGALLSPEEHIFELIHSRIDEKQRRILGWNEGRTFDDGVTTFRKKVEESPANFVAVHFVMVLEGFLIGLEWRPHRIQDEAGPEKDERHRAIGGEHATSSPSF